MLVLALTVIERLDFLQFVADNDWLTAEHTFNLFHRCLEQGSGITAGGCLVGTRRTFTFEDELEHHPASMRFCFYP